ncbi:hypothetical protein [Streptomyces sp. HUAS TT20]|nr:hypothetical protein [Streptomyces sp. HUAS 15-9]UXY30838.1 hypothetical protein N8I87_32655 [Streptomyces sp. HUAS 15-9]
MAETRSACTGYFPDLDSLARSLDVRPAHGAAATPQHQQPGSRLGLP